VNSARGRDLRAGDFRNALNTNGTLQLIYDPMWAVLTSATAGRQQFANNVNPANRLHPIAQKILAMYPLPNVDGTGAGNLTDNYGS